MQYAWKSLRFDLPPGVNDQLVFIDEAGSFQIAMNVDDKSGGFAAYVDNTMKDTAQALPGYQLVSKRERKVGGKDAFVIEQKAQAQSGIMRQLQAYVDLGAQVLIITAAHLDKAPKKTALEAVKGAELPAVDAAFEKILSSMTTGA